MSKRVEEESEGSSDEYVRATRAPTRSGGLRQTDEPKGVQLHKVLCQENYLYSITVAYHSITVSGPPVYQAKR